LNNCNVCNSVLLQQIDKYNKTSEICINCNNIDPRSKEIVNATPLFTCKLAPITYYDTHTAPIPEPVTIETIQKCATSTKPRLEYVNEILEQAEITKEINVKAFNGKIKIDWSKVIGYNEIKHIIDAALNNLNKKKTHIMLCGAPGTSKTVFLLTILESLKRQGLNAHYLDATTLSSSGVIEYMFTHDMNFALIDELDKLKREHQATFLNTLETGILQETKGSINKDKPKIRQKDMKNCVFIITANYQDKILQPLFTRMLTLLIPKYTKTQFYAIGVQLLNQQFGKTKEIAYYIVDRIWKIYTEERKEEPNLRYARDVAILTDNNKENIDPILQGITTYSKRYEE
jgi:DNA polymerase III delta prime subunit